MKTTLRLLIWFAAVVVLMSEEKAKALGVKPLARIVSTGTFAQEPEWFTTAPVGATQKLLQQIGWSAKDVDLWEVNEAFAVVPMALMAELKVPHDIVNVNGGAIALGHPVGMSGTRLALTALLELRRRGGGVGAVALCGGGGQGDAAILRTL